MDRRALLWLLAWGLSAPALAEEKAASVSPATVRLADLAWIAGDWVGEGEGDLSEEVWAVPAGDCMMGMWRWVSAGKAKLFELLTLTAGPQGPVLRLRHFDRELIGWEKEKERALTLPLVRYKEGEAVFEGLEAGGMSVGLVYRKPAADTLLVVLEKETKEGTKREEFRFRRRPSR